MVESSKILTVSYGTFSCTLEGFDDSFGTMKAIAEYFRDLAADDRYFGAEPPTPDVQMLAKIAEREITRRVEARTEDGEIVLRADAPVAPAMPPLAERRDPVQVAAAAVAPQVPVSEKQEFAVTDDATASVSLQDAGLEAEDTSSPLVASSQATPDTTMTFEDMTSDAAPTEVSGHHDADSIAAKLERIRAVVGQPDTTADQPYQEDLDAELMPDIAEIPDEIIADHEDHAEVAAVAEEAVAEAVEADAPADTPIEGLGDIMSSDMEFDDDTSEVDLDVPSDDLDDSPVVVEGPVAASNVAEDLDALEAASETLVLTASDEVEAEDDDVLAGLQAKIAQAAEQHAEVSEPIAAEEAPVVADTEVDTSDAEQGKIRATIVRMPKAETEVEDVKVNLATLDGVDDVETTATAVTSSLSDEEEQELQAELAELERTFADTDDDAAEPQAETAIEESSKPRNQLPDTDDETMSHILSQTDEALNEPEGSRRRNAIAHLKAAVAATEAARSLGDDGDTGEKAETAFREDLNEVVRPSRPTRPVKSETRTSRPRPAPLKLVASQRIDAPESDASDEPVKPRRVAAAKPVVTSDDASSFADFAEQIGASELPELLEAAAAYTAFVEGNEDFSRPQIMQKVQSTVDGEISREDGLRFFGTLLREGRISKVRGGRFQVADDTRYRPSA